MSQVLGRYHLVKKLAIGGMGEVWLAKQKGVAGFEKLVVVKTLLAHLKEDQEFVKRTGRTTRETAGSVEERKALQREVKHGEAPVGERVEGWRSAEFRAVGTPVA